MRRIAHRVMSAALILGLGLSAAWAQERPAQQQSPSQQQKQKPKDTRVASPAEPLPPLSSGTEKGGKPAGRPSVGQGQPASSEQRRQTLTGADQFMLGTMGRSHDYFIPILQVAESGDTNALNQFGSSTIKPVTMVGGSFTLNHVWSRYTFAANYVGSGFLYNQDLSLSTSAHSFGLSQTISGQRSSLLLADVVSYLPEASFGYSQFNGFGTYNVVAGGLIGNISGLREGYVNPNQSVLTGRSSRISNAALGQYNYNLSPLSSITFTGGYALLRFPDSDFIDSNVGYFGLGYNHSTSPKDTVAVNYFGSVFRYNNQPESDFMNHSVVLIYGHQITHLLSLHLGAGPQISVFSNGPNEDTVSWYATASLQYRLPRTQLALSYRHYTTAGAGVFRGAQTDQLQMAIGRKITRNWTGQVGAGYAYNKSLRVTSGLPTFNSWYATAGFLRTLGPYMSMFLSYNLQQQSSDIPFCIVSSCGSFYTRNYFSIGFNWHPRPIKVTEEVESRQ